AHFDRKLVIAQGVGSKNAKAREIECSVLGNDNPIASVPGEIVPIKEIYDYDAKYLVEGSRPLIPAELSKSKLKEVQKLAIAAFQPADCSALSPVNCHSHPRSNRMYDNRINIMPGFSPISMNGRLWETTASMDAERSGVLMQFILERHAEKKQNQYSR